MSSKYFFALWVGPHSYNIDLSLPFICIYLHLKSKHNLFNSFDDISVTAHTVWQEAAGRYNGIWSISFHLLTQRDMCGKIKALTTSLLCAWTWKCHGVTPVNNAF